MIESIVVGLVVMVFFLMALLAAFIVLAVAGALMLMLMSVIDLTYAGVHRLFTKKRENE